MYIAIDLKSFYASVECVDRGLDPLNTNLVVADASRTNKTICLAVSPALKSFGVPGRPRLFEVEQKVALINKQRVAKGKSAGTSQAKAPTGVTQEPLDSLYLDELTANPTLPLNYIVAVPRMALYIEYSTRIYDIYLKYIAPEDIHVYSIDEVFMDVTGYLRTYNCTAHELALRIIRDVLATTGITATAGVGENLYLAKVAMDIVAKHMPADADGVRIAELTEASYRRELWTHEPITDFWRVGKGIARRLAKMGLKTMGDVALLSTTDEELLYKTFGINAELLIDHAWGYENCTMADIKAYKPSSNSLSSGQVLMEPYTFAKARVIVREMTDELILSLAAKGLAARQVGLMVCYEELSDLESYAGEIVMDYYGRFMPKPAGGQAQLPRLTAYSEEIIEAVYKLYDGLVDPKLMVRRINISLGKLAPQEQQPVSGGAVQLDLFGQVEEAEEQKALRDRWAKKDEALQDAVVGIKHRFGKNSLLRGTNFEEGATGRDRNRQIGGHRS